VGEVAHRDRPKITILGVGGKIPIFDHFPKNPKIGHFWQISQNPKNGHFLENPIFQDFPKMAKILDIPKMGIFGKMGKLGIFAIVVKKGDFLVFWENGEKWKSVILTDLVKNVKKGDFLTFYHIVEKEENTVFPGRTVLGKKVKIGVFV
jgi:hypothetical protein